MIKLQNYTTIRSFWNFINLRGQIYRCLILPVYQTIRKFSAFQTMRILSIKATYSLCEHYLKENHQPPKAKFLPQISMKNRDSNFLFSLTEKKKKPSFRTIKRRANLKCSSLSFNNTFHVYIYVSTYILLVSKNIRCLLNVTIPL